MAIFPRVSGAYKEMTDGKVKVGGAWKQAVEVFEKVNGAWKSAWNNVAIYIVCNTYNADYEFFFDNMDETVVLDNLIVEVYDKNDALLYTMTFGDLETTSGAYSVYDSKYSYGEIGIRSYPNENKVEISININYDSSDARKFIVTADKVSFK